MSRHSSFTGSMHGVGWAASLQGYTQPTERSSYNHNGASTLGATAVRVSAPRREVRFMMESRRRGSVNTGSSSDMGDVDLDDIDFIDTSNANEDYNVSVDSARSSVLDASSSGARKSALGASAADDRRGSSAAGAVRGLSTSGAGHSAYPMQSMRGPSSECGALGLGYEPRQSRESGFTLTWDEALLAQCDDFSLLIEAYRAQYQRSVSAQSVRPLGMYAPAVSGCSSHSGKLQGSSRSSSPSRHHAVQQRQRPASTTNCYTQGVEHFLDYC